MHGTQGRARAEVKCIYLASIDAIFRIISTREHIVDVESKLGAHIVPRASVLLNRF